MVQKKKKSNVLNLNDQIKSSVKTLLKLVKTAPKKNILIEDGEPVFLQVSIFKIPELNELVKRRIVLKHPVTSGTPEVCLIVRDYIKNDRIKRPPDAMIDITIDRFEEHLKKHKITGITNIMPYLQLKTEYETFELRRKLVNRFDTFLCSSQLCGKDYFFNCLGKIFIEKNKYPIAVKLPGLNDHFDENANKRIQSAITSTVFYIKPSSDNYSIRVGNTLQKGNLIRNIKAVIKKLIQSPNIIPGGFRNVRCLNIKSAKSKAVPVYVNLSDGSEIPVPELKPNAPVLETVEGEITTQPGKKVTVLPDGTVITTPLSRKSGDSDGDSDAEKDEGDEGVEEPKEIEKVSENIQRERETKKKKGVKRKGQEDSRPAKKAKKNKKSNQITGKKPIKKSLKDKKTKKKVKS